MQNGLTRQRGSATAKEDGQTLPAQGEAQDRVPALPHERDESADSQATARPDGERMGEIAHDDATSDRTDTDRGPVTDAVYRKVKR